MKTTRLIAILAIFLLCIFTGGCLAEDLTGALDAARATIESTGLKIDDASYEAACACIADELAFIENAENITDEGRQMMLDMYSSEDELIYSLLLNIGLGSYDEETLEWIPSPTLYAFDAEVYEFETMYTVFLQAVDALIPEIEITDVTEDSGISVENNEYTDTGVHTVSFVCNGTPRTFELVSMQDWFDVMAIDLMNGVLAEEGCEGRLHVITHESDQLMMLVYGDEAMAEALRPFAENIY